MNPKDQLVKEISKLRFHKHIREGRCPKTIRDHIIWGDALTEAIFRTKSFLKNKSIIEKGDLLTKREIENIEKFCIEFFPNTIKKLKALAVRE